MDQEGNDPVPGPVTPAAGPTNTPRTGRGARYLPAVLDAVRDARGHPGADTRRDSGSFLTVHSGQRRA